MKKSISEFDRSENYSEDDIFVLDDRQRKYDEKTGKIVKPGEPGYDELPELIR